MAGAAVVTHIVQTQTPANCISAMLSRDAATHKQLHLFTLLMLCACGLERTIFCLQMPHLTSEGSGSEASLSFNGAGAGMKKLLSGKATNMHHRLSGAQHTRSTCGGEQGVLGC